MVRARLNLVFPLSFIFHLPRDSPTSLRLRQRRPATRWHRACPRRPNQPSESAPALETRTRLSSSIHAAIAGAARLLALLEMVAPTCLPSARLVALPQTSCLPLTRAGPFLRRRGCDVNARHWGFDGAAGVCGLRLTSRREGLPPLFCVFVVRGRAVSYLVYCQMPSRMTPLWSPRALAAPPRVW